jgi:competence protein ComEC
LSSHLPREYIAILDVGHGNATVVSTRAGTVVVDAGSGAALHEFLRNAGIRKIDTLALSHADQDHIGAVVGLLASSAVVVDNVFLNTDSQKQSDVWKDLLYELQASKAKGRIVQFAPTLAQGAPATLTPCGVRVEICAPCPYLAGLGPGSTTRERRTITSNTVSAVIRISTAKGPMVVLMGDIDDLGLKYLRQFSGEISAPLVVFPHHGGLPGGSASPSKFTRAVVSLTDPSVVVFSIGRDHFQNPVPEIARTIRRLRPKCRIVCTQMSTHCSASVHLTPSSAHLSSAFAAGRHAGISCGGTIVIDIADPSRIFPDARRHRIFIKRHAATPLCVDKGNPSGKMRVR